MMFVIINHHNSWFAEDYISSKNLNELYFYLCSITLFR